MNITVYLGAFPGNDPSFELAVKELGTWIGKSHNALIYGGSKSGLMGLIAESTLLARLIVTQDMEERKAKMIELGDAFIAFPGGTGTLEEIAEIISKVSLKQLDAPCILYNLNGYYDHLKALLALMIEKGLSSEERQEGIFFAENLEEIRQILSGK